MKKNSSQNFPYVLLLFNCQSSKLTFCGFLKNFPCGRLVVGKLLICQPLSKLRFLGMQRGMRSDYT